MAFNRLGLVQRYRLFDWNKFSKDYKKTYKEDNGEPLKNNTAIALTFGKVQKTFGGIKEPEIEDVVTLVKLGNKDCNDEEATKIISEALDSDELYDGIKNKDEASGILLIFMLLMVCFYSDLNISNNLTGRAIRLRELYIEGLNKEEDIKEKNKDTDRSDDKNTDK